MLTKEDLKSIALIVSREVTRSIKESESRMKLYIDEKITESETRVIDYIDGRFVQADKDIQVYVRREFTRFGHIQNSRFTDIERNQENFDVELYRLKKQIDLSVIA